MWLSSFVLKSTILRYPSVVLFRFYVLLENRDRLAVYASVLLNVYMEDFLVKKNAVLVIYDIDHVADADEAFRKR